MRICWFRVSSPDAHLYLRPYPFRSDCLPKTIRKQPLQNSLRLVKGSRIGLALACVWILDALLLLPMCSLVAIGQEPPPDASAESGTVAVEETETEDPVEVPEEGRPPKRRILKRLGPQPVTPEQREEAERLKKLAAKYGTDPTAIVGRLQLSSQYADLSHGARFSDTVARVDLPFRRNFLIRVDVPFHRWIDPNRPGATSAQGLGDPSVVTGWRVYNTPEYALLIGAAGTFPAADERALGSGKYTAGPFFATARFLPRLDSFLFGVFQHQISVGGDPARQAVSLTRAIGQVNTIWAERWWTIVQGVWQIDWERSGKSSMTLEFEVGRSLIGRLGVYARPGVGIWGRDVIGAYDWNIEAGIRYMFPSF
jgi:hypothetical protein